MNLNYVRANPNTDDNTKKGKTVRLQVKMYVGNQKNTSLGTTVGHGTAKTI